MKKILKRSLSVFLAITILLSSVYAGLCQVDFSGLFAVKAKAVSGGTCGSNLTWEIDDNNTLIISGTGDMNNFSIDEHNIHHTPWENHRLSIKAIVIESGATSIGEYAFADFSNLSSVTLCDTITTISSNAFRNCFGLTAIVIPSSVKCIDGYAFGDCKNLASITLPDDITGIDGYAFYNTTYFNNDSNWENGVLYIDNYLLCAARSLDGACAVKDGTKIIAKNAFVYCKNITSVVIPNSVTHIGQYAFGDCTSLTSVTISTGVVRIENGVFSGCSSLSSISIPINVTSIGSYAFSDCTSLVSITIPDTVTNISSDVFYNTGYYNDENNWEDGVLYINNHLICAYKYDSQDEYTDCIEGDYSIKQGTKTIADSAFSNCLNLTSLVIPNTVEYIGASAFHGCTSLALITIPDSVTSIGGYAFCRCTSLALITIPDSVTSIGGYAFCRCTSLASITIPASVTNISESVFRGCTGLTAINVNENNNNYSSVNGVLFNKEKTLLIQYPSGKSDEEYIIPDTVKIIGDFAFLDCESLTLVTMPDSLTKIGSYAFESCVNLVSIEIPDSVTEINDGAFYKCTSLSSVVISNNITTIERKMFEYCGSLKSITIPDSVTEIGSFAFSSTGITLITIPDGVTKIWGGAFYNCRSLTSITIPDSVTSLGGIVFGECVSLGFVSIGKNVTSIDGYAFYNCYSLKKIEWNATKIEPLTEDSELFGDAGSKSGIEVVFGDGVEEIPDYLFSCYVSSSPKIVSVSIPSSVTHIGRYAFGGGGSIESVYINDIAAWCNIDFGVNPLYNAKYLYVNGVLTTDLVIPNGVTCISDDAFLGFENLNSITIPDSVTSIGQAAFRGCTGLTSVTIPGNVTDIGDSAFSICTGLAAVTVSDGVKSIGYGAFYGCSSLTSVTIPGSVTDIGDSAFSICTGLTSLTVSDGVKSIGYGAFYGCSSLASVTIPSSVKDINADAFYGCTALSSIVIADSVINISSTAFLDTAYYNDDNNWVNDVLYINNHLIRAKETLSGEYQIKDGTKTIVPNAFQGCADVISIKIPDTVTNIGSYAFEECSSLTSIIIPESITSISSGVFYNCSSLTSVIIPNSVTSIGERAFRGCSSLTSVYITSIDAWFNIDFESEDSNPLYYADALYLNEKPVTEVVIPDGVAEIKEYAFSFNSLDTLIIPATVTKIADSAFYDCTKLKYVFYMGSEAQWNELLEENDITKFTNIPVHYGTREHTLEWKNAQDFDCVNKPVNYKHKMCTVCGYISETKEILTNGHLFVNDVCEYCSVPVYEYSIINNEVTITAYNGPDKNVVIPSNFDGYPVTSIGKSAFCNNKAMESVVIPNSVTIIDEAAFEGCENLKSVNIPEGVTCIGDSAFASCINLTSIIIPDSVTTIGERAFYYCRSLTSLVIPDSVNNIGESAFRACYGLTDVVIGNGVSKIPADAFTLCTGLITILISETITQIGDNAFSDDGAPSYVFYPGTEEQWKSIVWGSGSSDFENAVVHYNSTNHVALDTWENCLDFDCNSGYPGTLYKHCKYCDVVVETKDIPSGHFFENDICLICGCYIFSYDIVNGNAIITDYNGKNNEVVIPSVINGYPVTGIGESAFSCCRDITKIVLPDTVTSIGKEAFFCCESLSEIVIPDTVTSIGKEAFFCCESLSKLVIPNGVTEICHATFMGCSNLASITIPGSVTTVGGQAFDGCESLTSIALPEGVTKIDYDAFSGCIRLASVSISDSVTDIKQNAFSGCTSLFSITIPKGVTKIDRLAFNGCTSLATIEVSADNSSFSSVDGVLFNKAKTALVKYPIGKVGVEYIIPDTVTGISSCAFIGCANLTSVIIPDSVTSIGDNAFSESTSLTSITIPDSVTSIGAFAFSDCTSLVSFVFPSQVIKILSGTFEGCSNLVSVSIPRSVKIIYSTAFRECTSLKDIYYNDSKTQWENISVLGTYMENATIHYNISDWVINDAKFVLNGDGTSYTIADCSVDCSGEVRIPETYRGLPVTAIGTDAFRDCSGITSIVVPDCVTSIGGSAFRNCTNLTKVDLPQNITTIPGAMCYGCEKLENIIIPGGVISIGGYAFTGCASLKTAVIPDSVKASGSSIFANCKSLVMVCNENSAAHNYAVNSNVSYIVNSDNTIVDLVTGKIQTNVLGGNVQSIVSCSDNLTFTTDATYAGTGAIIRVEKESIPHSQYTLVVNGDTNGDSVCDVLDCFDVERASNGNIELFGAYAIAADSNSDEIIDATDYQIIVNKAIA